TQATKQALAEEKAARDKAVADAKARRQELADFITRLNKIQEDNDLSSIKDAYAKEQKQIQIQIDDQKRQVQQDLQQKKITADQATKLDIELEKNRQIKLDASRDKHNQDIADKEATFQKDLAAVRAKAAAGAATDLRTQQRQQLVADYKQQRS